MRLDQLQGWLSNLGAWSHLHLKTLSAEDRSPLGGLEGDGCLLATLGTDSSGFRANSSASPRTFRLALFAMLGVIDELLVVEKELLA